MAKAFPDFVPQKVQVAEIEDEVAKRNELLHKYKTVLNETAGKLMESQAKRDAAETHGEVLQEQITQLQKHEQILQLQNYALNLRERKTHGAHQERVFYLEKHLHLAKEYIKEADAIILSLRESVAD